MLLEESSTAGFGARWLALSLLFGLGCDSDDRDASGQSAQAGDAGLSSPRDASQSPGAPGLDSSLTNARDARVVLPIEDPSTRADATASGTGSGTGDGGAVDAGSSGKICGGIAGLFCKDSEYCSQEDASNGVGCGFADSTGQCIPRARACDAVLAPVCGCDHKTYGNDCEAHAAGVSIANRGECASSESVDCDDRPGKVTCKRARPTCTEGQVPAVVGGCWGDCVAIDQCVCKEADACPERETYVCHMSAGHCGPFVN
jgi:hypothetical protein